ncbi:MAG: hypothetical protein KBD96_04310 [Brachymonas sp.]|jgi:hypothetical protein|nr:hypothetical protein [Brachymonas sp.]
MCDRTEKLLDLHSQKMELPLVLTTVCPASPKRISSIELPWKEESRTEGLR